MGFTVLKRQKLGEKISSSNQEAHPLLQKDVKPCSLAASYKLKLLTAVQALVLFFHHWRQMARAIIKSYNSNCKKTSALGQQLVILSLFWEKAEVVLQLNNFTILTI